ncbi:hypothetical protein EGI26_09285 [Lacihabitans sp. CCS-44]|uniref:lipocalin family protein n=1 Tax=Lacihabitans sp. CCS-44 TaxID=2487331 RepID=UPI0020CB8454|nr:DUF5004 domain-containing protein [Lacihabitans sp. CCS-44]MCP9755346.1 hypothetical protein [Lacihabitans sp. CCS-44]
MKFLKLRSLVLVAVLLIGLGGCKKEDVGPNSKIVGTWKITSAVYKDSSGPLEFWALYNAVYACTKDITMSFTEDGKYSVSEPTGCVDEDGVSLFLFTKTGTFTLTDDISLDIIENDATPYKGKVVFADGKFTWTYDEVFQGEATSLTVTFTKVK